MTDEENIRFIECCDDRFEIIKRAREHIINATNIESHPEEMEVLDNFLFRCWQMGWLKNDYKALEKENEQLKKEVERFKKMKKNCLDVMRIQGSNLTDDYMAGMYNGMVVVYNSCFLKDDELEKSYCSKNEYNKWELEE